MSTFYNNINHSEPYQHSNHNNSNGNNINISDSYQYSTSMSDQQFPSMSNGPGPGVPMARRQFTELHPKDQTIKLNRKARIESNWGCNIQDALPLHMRPRMELKKGAKARVGDIGIAEEIWWNWSVELLRSLEELSSMTALRLDFAQELLTLEVKQRQDNPKHPQRKIVELLLGDVQRVIDGMRRNQQAINQETAEMEVDDDEEAPDYDEEEYDVGPLGHQGEEGEEDMNGDGNEMAISGRRTREVYSSPIPHRQAPTSARRGTINKQHSSPAVSAYGDRPNRVAKHMRRSSNFELKAIEMRARAIRLRSQSNKLEAEATELELEVAQIRAEQEAEE